MALLLTEAAGGTKVSSTRYVHYGTITTRLKTGRWGGVVTAFITMSNIKDEIDWEFPGAKTTQGQTNFFWEGIIRQSSICVALHASFSHFLQPLLRLVTQVVTSRIPLATITTMP